MKGKISLFVAAVVAVPIIVSSASGFADDQGFHDESELGAAIVSGNTSSETYNAKQSNTYAWQFNLLKISGRYLNTRSTSGTGQSQTPLADSARAWDASLRYEREISTSFSAFSSYGLESDVFNGYVQRNNFDLGMKYFFAKSDDTTWSAEAGYRNIVTLYPSAPNAYTNDVRLYTEVVQSLSKTASFKYFVEYVQVVGSNVSSPGYTAQQDYYLNTEPSVTAILTSLFSIKAAYLFKYMNYLPPNSSAKTYLDTIFTTSLVAKF